MSLRAMLWALYDAPTDDLPAGAFRVLLALADHADDRGWNAWPSANTLAGNLRYSRRTVLRHLAALRDAGLIYEGDQRCVEHIRGDRRPVVYNLDLGLRGDKTDTPHGVTPAVMSPAHGVTETGSRGDSPVPDGVTPAVTQTVLNQRTTRARARARNSVHSCGYEHPDYEGCPRTTNAPPGGSLAALVASIGRGLEDGEQP